MTRSDLLNKFYAALAMKLLTFRMTGINSTKTKFEQQMIDFSRELIQDYHDTILNNSDILLDLGRTLVEIINRAEDAPEINEVKDVDAVEILRAIFGQLRPEG